MSKFFLVASFLLATAAPSYAAQSADDAVTHFRAVASGDIAVLMRGYHEAAQLQWVGGPLDGLYAGKSSIQTVWEKLGQAQGNPLKMTVEALEESGNPKGATVTANVLFVGKAPIKVRYVLVYRDNLIVSETWQVDPKLVVGEASSTATKSY